MKSTRGWIAGVLIVIAVLAAVFIGQQHPDSPEHSSNSDAGNGTSALLLFAGSLGHPTDQLAGSFAPPSAKGLMFVFTPTSPFSSDEADATATWVRNGGVLVYASETGDPSLDASLGVQRSAIQVPSGSADASAPVAGGVQHVAGSGYLSPLTIGPRQVALLRVGPYVLGYLERFGGGTVVVLATPLALCNGYLEKADNGLFAADLIGLVAAGAPVAFDEFHHGITLSAVTPQAWILTPWGAALLWLIVAVFFGLLLRGRRFGPLVERQAPVSRAEAEWAVAVGELLRRAGARAVTLGVLAGASEREVAARTGLAAQPRDRFWKALWQRAPDVASELDSAERALYGSAANEKDLLAAAQWLHRIAYPTPGERPRPPATMKES